MFFTRSITLVCIATCFGAYGHDFEWYKHKTCELFPVLKIDESKVTFRPIHKKPTLEQRIANPTTIFIDLEYLSNLPDNVALFECIIEAELATITWKDVNVYPEEPSSDEISWYKKPLYAIAGTILGMIIWHSFCERKIYRISFPICVGLICYLITLMWQQYEKKENKIEAKEEWLRECTYYLKEEKTTKIIEVIYNLLESCNTAPLAFIGFARYHSLIPNKNPKQAYECSSIFIKLLEWASWHRHDWEKIHQQLPNEVSALYNDSLESLQKGQSVWKFGVTIRPPYKLF